MSGWRSTCVSWQSLLNTIIWICLCHLYNEKNITSGNYCVLCYNYCVLCYNYCVLCCNYCVVCYNYCVLCYNYCVLCCNYCVLCYNYCVLCYNYCVLCCNYCVLCYNYCVLCYSSDQLDGFYDRCERNVVARICVCMITRKDLYNPIALADQGSRRIMTLEPRIWWISVHLCLGISFFEN